MTNPTFFLRFAFLSAFLLIGVTASAEASGRDCSSDQNWPSLSPQLIVMVLNDKKSARPWMDQANVSKETFDRALKRARVFLAMSDDLMQGRYQDKYGSVRDSEGCEIFNKSSVQEFHSYEKNLRAAGVTASMEGVIIADPNAVVSNKPSVPSPKPQPATSTVCQDYDRRITAQADIWGKVQGFFLFDVEYKRTMQELRDDLARWNNILSAIRVNSAPPTPADTSRSLMRARGQRYGVVPDNSSSRSPLLPAINLYEELRTVTIQRIQQKRGALRPQIAAGNAARQQGLALKGQAEAAGCGVRGALAEILAKDLPTADDNLINDLMNADPAADAPGGSSAKNVVRYTGVQGKVEVQRDGGGWQSLTSDGTLRVGANVNIHTGFKASVTVEFAGHAVLIQPMTMLRLLSERDGSITETLKFGEVKATVNRSRGSAADFNVKTPTTTTSQRGTIFTVAHDSSANRSMIAVEEGQVLVTPTNASLKPVLLGAGERVEVGASDMSGAANRRFCSSAAGTWTWQSGAVVELREDGAVSGANGLGGRWGNDATGHRIQIKWSNRNIDDLQLSADGYRLSGGNQYGAESRASRVGGCGAPAATSARGSSGAGGSWSYASDGGWHGTWTRRGNTSVFDAELRGPSGEHQTIVEQVNITGNRFHSVRLQSTDGKLCTLDGTLLPDGKRYSGTAQCPGGPNGWSWTVTTGGAVSVAGPAALADRYNYQSAGGWNGTWVRRGSSNLFDSRLHGPKGEDQIIVEQVTITGNRIHSQRIQTSDGKLCTLDGTLQGDGRSYQGTAQCPGGPNDWPWRIAPANP